jgi:hypothetical protein
MSLETNFNAAPYFDDYSANSNYYRVLYKPGVAVQARELTQSQTILQDQIDKFGRHIFKEGSVVEGCTLAFDDGYAYVKVTDTATNGFVISVGDFVGDKLVSAANLQAVIVNAIAGLETNDPNLNTFYVKYLNSTNYANGAQQRTFDPDEVLEIRTPDDVQVAELAVANAAYSPIGTGYAVSISEGTVFNKGFFITVQPQTIVVSKYDNSPEDLTVGFITDETIATSDSDPSLFDNALGSPNFNAPGANRLKLFPRLATRPIDTSNSAANTSNFFSVVDFNGGKPVVKLVDPQYAKIGNEMARRTFEESGNYIVDPFELSVASNTTNSNNLVLEVGRGLGYVQGYRVEYADTNRANIRKGTDTLYFPNQIVTANYGNYVIVNELAGVFDINTLDDVGLYATAATKLTAGDYTPTGSAPANLIGTAKVRGLEYDSGIPGTPSCTYRMYLFDINITAGNFSFADVRSVYATDSASVAGYADAVLVSGSAVLRETATPDVVFSLGRSAIQTVNTTATSFFYRTKGTRTFQANGTAVLTPAASHPGGLDTIALTGSLSEANELRFVVVANTAANAVNVTAVSVSVNTSSPNVTGNAVFTSNFEVGDYVSVGNSSVFNVRRVTSITNTTHMVVNANFSYANTTATVARHFPAGAPIPFTRDDSANVVVASDGSSATFNLGTNLASTFVATIYYDAFRNQAVQASKVINKNRFVKIQANTHPAGNQGPWSLGIADVTKIRAVYQGTSYATTNQNLSRLFSLDSGQKGSYYGLAQLSIKPGSGHTVGANDRLLVELDHLTPDYSGGIGYFSVMSYPIDDANTANTTAILTQEIPVFTSETGVSYDLRDSIDFRPYSNNTANSATLIANATENPSANVVLFIDVDGAYSPSPDKNFNTAFSYYLGRKDKIALSPEGVINTVEGAPAANPLSPRDLDGAMTLGVLTISPYPSLSQADVRTYQRPEYGVTIDLQQNRRYTMRDIGTIDKRMARLEYYTSLSLLESSAKTLIVKDDTGAERFKNGFIVDPFKGFTVSDTSSPEFKASIDIKLQEMAPTVNRTYVDLDLDTGASTGVVKEGNLITLVGNTVPYIEQPFASKVRNCVENIIYVWTGNIELTPGGDAQPDIDRNPDVVANFDLSGLTPLINALPNLTGVERIVSSSPVTTTVDRTSTTVNRQNWTQTTTTTRDVVATTTETTIRSDLDFSASTLNTSFDFGDVVQDIAIQQFIRPRRISFSATNLKPNTRVYAYFDGQPVSQHCSPTSSISLGDPLVTDSLGTIQGRFIIPAETFKTGDRVFRLVDVDDLVVAADSVTTQAAATYSASNITITKARLGLNSRLPDIAINTVNVTQGTRVSSRTVSSTVINTTVQQWDPIAQTFLINEIEDNTGIFMKKLDLFFRTKHPTLGVEVQIREVENGSPTLKIVPFGRKHLTAAQVTVSNDSTAVTSFEFDTPVFLKAGSEYCFVVMPDGSNDGYNIWLGELGATDIRTGNPVYFNNSTGVMFTSSTNRIWTPFQKEDIKFVIHRKNFTTTSGTAVYKNSNTEYLTANNFGGFFLAGEKVYVSNAVNIISSNVSTSNSSNAIAVIANSTSNAQALFANGSYIYVTSNTGNTTDVRFITSVPNASHVVVDSILSFTDGNCSIGYLKSNGALFGYMSRVSLDTGIVHLERSSANSTSGFGNVVTGTANAILIGEESRAKANLVSVDNLVYSVVIPQFSYISPTGTSAYLQMKGSNATTNDAVYTTMTGDLETFFTDRERTIRSYSNELQAGGAKSVEVTIPLTATTNKTSPFIDDIKSNIVTLRNVSGNTSTLARETYPTGGNTGAKYISKRVVLAEGQDAEDLQVYLSAYKPSNTDITVYAKFLNGEDAEGIENKWWTPLNQNTSSAVVSSRVDRNDFKEFVYDLPFKYAVNAASNTAMADYAVYGTFTNTSISSNTITISNTTPLDIGTLVYYIGTASNSISNGFYSVFTSNTTAVRLATAGTSTPVTITPAASANTASLYVVPQTAFKDLSLSNVVSYYTSTGAHVHSYKTFAVKIVMTTEEGSHIVPRVSDMRAIALQT